MSFVRDRQQATLAALHARGHELVARYRDVLASDHPLPEPCQAEVERVLEERTALVEALAAAERTSGDLPKAGNTERAAVQSVGDLLSKTLAGGHSLAERLRGADRGWLQEVEAAEALEWNLDQAELLARLANHIRTAQARLRDACT